MAPQPFRGAGSRSRCSRRCRPNRAERRHDLDPGRARGDGGVGRLDPGGVVRGHAGRRAGERGDQVGPRGHDRQQDAGQQQEHDGRLGLLEGAVRPDPGHDDHQHDGHRAPEPRPEQQHVARAGDPADPVDHVAQQQRQAGHPERKARHAQKAHRPRHPVPRPRHHAPVRHGVVAGERHVPHGAVDLDYLEGGAGREAPDQRVAEDRALAGGEQRLAGANRDRCHDGARAEIVEAAGDPAAAEIGRRLRIDHGRVHGVAGR